MEIGKKVKVSSHSLSNFLLTGEVIKEGIASNGSVMSKVKFSNRNEAWYVDQDIKTEDTEQTEIILH